MENQSGLLQALRLNYLYAEHYFFPEKWNFHESPVPYSMIRFMTNGKAKYRINESAFIVEANDIVHIPQGSSLYCEALSKEIGFVSVRYSAAFPLKESDLWVELMGYETKLKCDDASVRGCFEGLMKAKSGQGRGKHFILRGYVELILGYILNHADIREERIVPHRSLQIGHKPDNRIQIVQDYMFKHVDANVSVEELSQVVKVNPATLRRLFKQHTGKAPNDFMTELEMTVAAKKILETDERISDISYSVGILDPNYFSRLFKAHFGVTPYNYRRLARD